MAVEILGVRHHSPACARRVARRIAQWRPQAVLIEGPSDFNARLAELQLDHRLPIALYSYAHDGERAAQCWFPFLDHSPEWVALRGAHRTGVPARFIDLPHWQYRALAGDRRHLRGQPRPRYAEVVARLCARFGCDGDDALWDHLFEAASDGAELDARLDLYFDELRGNEPGSEQDQARETFMAQWVAWAAAHHERVLVVCGGWHQRCIAAAWPGLDGAQEPQLPQPSVGHPAGSHLVPFDHRQVDALGGYSAGMPSPQFYQWVWQHGLSRAGELARQHIVERLRRKDVVFSTADLIAFEQAAAGLARLRGHSEALRVDLLDALQTSLVKEALDRPPPWSESTLLLADHHPVLREALLALTGEGGGALHADTPQPPLLHDVQQRLAACGLVVAREARAIVLDRRRPEDTPRAQLLWQLRVLGIDGADLRETRAPHAAQRLPAALRFEEHWRLQRSERWYPDLIEASVHGATLDAAARSALLERAALAGGDPARLAACLLDAVRAGLAGIGHDLALQLRQGLAHSQDHGALADAAQALAELAHVGFWGDAVAPLFEQTLTAIAERLLWLLEGRDSAGGPATVQPDVKAARVFDALVSLAPAGLDTAWVLGTLARLARSAARPPALRGAALAVVFVHEALGEAAHDEVISITRSMPPRDALGDFLYGLFSGARALAVESEAIVRAVQAALQSLGDEDFLVALPQLRAAFGWFPARERGALASHVARLLGLPGGASALLAREVGPEAWLDARRIETQALSWAQELGLARWA